MLFILWTFKATPAPDLRQGHFLCRYKPSVWSLCSAEPELDERYVWIDRQPLYKSEGASLAGPTGR